MKFSQKFFENWQFLFAWSPMKISHKLCDRMDGTQFWCFPMVSSKFLAMHNITLLCSVVEAFCYKNFYRILTNVKMQQNEYKTPGLDSNSFCICHLLLMKVCLKSRRQPQFYIQLLYKPHFGKLILLFGRFGQL